MDYDQKMMRTVRTLLKSLNLPAKNFLWYKFTFILIFVNMVVMQTAHVTYMAKNIKDVATMANTSSTISTTFQGIWKFTSLYINSHRVKTIFSISLKQFWPIHLTDKSTAKSLNKLCMLTEFSMLMFYVLIFFCCCLLLLPPLFLGVRELPLASYYPFHWEASPVYEIMYVWQWFINLYGVCFVVGCHDFLFVGSMISLIAQFRILKFVMRSIGTDREARVSKEVMELFGEDDMETDGRSNRLLIKCVQHHRVLMRFCDMLEQTFSPIVFLQFVESVSGLCLGVFLVSLVDGVNFIKLIFFIIGHLAQLFLYCAVGNELMYQSENLADAAFDSGWYKHSCVDLRGGLILMIQIAQRGKKITALGMADLNILSFIAVLRSSISFSTLLKTFIDKQNRAQA